MARVNLSGMSVEALMDLRKRVDEMLHERRAEIEKQLERMDRAIAVVGGARVVRGGSPLRGKKSRRNIGGNFADLLDSNDRAGGVVGSIPTVCSIYPGPPFGVCQNEAGRIADLAHCAGAVLQFPAVFGDPYLVVFLPLHTGPAATKAGQQNLATSQLDQLATGFVRLEPGRPDDDVDWLIAAAVDDGIRDVPVRYAKGADDDSR